MSGRMSKEYYQQYHKKNKKRRHKINREWRDRNKPLLKTINSLITIWGY